jgi:limonene-1,2-epoxide hydrolase
MSKNMEMIKDFCAAWSRLDASELASYFTEDGIYHNMPAGPIQGRDAIEKFIGQFAGAWTTTEWDVLNIAEANDVVFAERLDRTRAGDKSVDLPCTGVFEIQDGKIACWRDYFDIGTYARAMQ